jgi:ribosomal protein L37E
MMDETKWLVEPDGTVLMDEPGSRVPNHIALIRQAYGKDYARQLLSSEPTMLGLQGTIDDVGQIHVGGWLMSDMSQPSQAYDPFGSSMGALRTSDAVHKVYAEAANRGIPIGNMYNMLDPIPGGGFNQRQRPFVSRLEGRFYDHITGDDIQFHEIDHIGRDPSLGILDESWQIIGDDGNTYWIRDDSVMDEQGNVVGDFDPYANPNDQDDMESQWYDDWSGPEAKVAAVYDYALPPGGLHGRTHRAMGAAGLSARVTYPPGIVEDHPEAFVSEIPSSTGSEDMMITTDYMIENGGQKIGGVPVTLETEDDPESVKAILDTLGGLDVANVENLPPNVQSVLEPYRRRRVQMNLKRADEFQTDPGSVYTDQEKKAITCPNCGSHSYRAFSITDNENAKLKCLTCGEIFPRQVLKNPEAKVALNYPSDPAIQAQILGLTQQIATAAQSGDRTTVLALQQQLEQLLGGNPNMPAQAPTAVPSVTSMRGYNERANNLDQLRRDIIRAAGLQRISLEQNNEINQLIDDALVSVGGRPPHKALQYDTYQRIVQSVVEQLIGAPMGTPGDFINPDAPGDMTLNDMGIPPEGEDYYRNAAIEKHSPGKEHMKGVSPKRNRQYEHVLESCRDEHPDWSEDRCKELAARTVNKYRAEHGETKSSLSATVKRLNQIKQEIMREATEKKADDMWPFTPRRHPMDSPRMHNIHNDFARYFDALEQNGAYEKYVAETSSQGATPLSYHEWYQQQMAALEGQERPTEEVNWMSYPHDSSKMAADNGKYQPGTRVKMVHPTFKGEKGSITEFKSRHPELGEESYKILLDSGKEVDDCPESHFMKHKSSVDASAPPDSIDNHFIGSMTFESFNPYDEGPTMDEDFGPDDLDPQQGPTCPMCDGPGEYLGSLGSKEWFRCRNCGMDFSNTVEHSGKVADKAPSTGWPASDQPKHPTGLPEPPKFDGNKTKMPYDPPASDAPYDEPDLSGGDVACPNCDSNAKSMGKFGPREYFRCSNGDCQMEFSYPNSDESAKWGIDDPDDLFGLDAPTKRGGPIPTPGAPTQMNPMPMQQPMQGVETCPVCGQPTLNNGVCVSCGYVDQTKMQQPTDPTQAAGRISAVKDSTGNELQEGNWYILHGSGYRVPDIVKIIKLKNDRIEAHFETDKEGKFPLQIESSDVETYTFDPYKRSEDPIEIDERAQHSASGWSVEARRSFSPKEQKDLIEENMDGRARNFDKLDLKGTHYETKDFALIDRGSLDLDFLWG